MEYKTFSDETIITDLKMGDVIALHQTGLFYPSFGRVYEHFGLSLPSYDCPPPSAPMIDSSKSNLYRVENIVCFQYDIFHGNDKKILYHLRSFDGTKNIVYGSTCNANFIKSRNRYYTLIHSWSKHYEKDYYEKNASFVIPILSF